MEFAHRVQFKKRHTATLDHQHWWPLQTPHLPLTIPSIAKFELFLLKTRSVRRKFMHSPQEQTILKESSARRCLVKPAQGRCFHGMRCADASAPLSPMPTHGLSTMCMENCFLDQPKTSSEVSTAINSFMYVRSTKIWRHVVFPATLISLSRGVPMIFRIMIMYVRTTSQEVTRSEVFLQAFHT